MAPPLLLELVDGRERHKLGGRQWTEDVNTIRTQELEIEKKGVEGREDSNDQTEGHERNESRGR